MRPQLLRNTEQLRGSQRSCERNLPFRNPLAVQPREKHRLPLYGGTHSGVRTPKGNSRQPMATASAASGIQRFHRFFGPGPPADTRRVGTERANHLVGFGELSHMSWQQPHRGAAAEIRSPRGSEIALASCAKTSQRIYRRNDSSAGHRSWILAAQHPEHVHTRWDTLESHVGHRGTFKMSFENV